MTHILYPLKLWRRDMGKLRFDYIPPEMHQALAEVLLNGAEKYAPHDWETSETAPTIDNHRESLLRHLHDHAMGIEKDHESGLHPLKHAFCRLGMMVTLIERDEEWFKKGIIISGPNLKEAQEYLNKYGVLMPVNREEDIDYSDIPEVTDEWMAKANVYPEGSTFKLCIACDRTCPEDYCEECALWMNNNNIPKKPPTGKPATG